jgi:parallel beta-helix repeat protein
MRLHLLILSCFFFCQGKTATYYVSNSGSNSNDGLSPGNAFLTIQYAENQCAPGDSVLVANGSYAGFYVDVSGTSSAPIVFLANGSAVFITTPTSTTDGINVEGDEDNGVNYIELNGFIVNNMPRNGIRLVYAHNCIVRNNSCFSNFERGIFTGFTDNILIEFNTCTYSDDEHGIYVSNSSDEAVIRYNICHHNNRGGIQINADASQGGDGVSSDPEIYGNILYENGVAGGAAINLDGVQGAFIYNNLLYENHASGIALFQQDGAEPSINAKIIHNTIINASDARWCVLIVDGATGAQVFNNILINQHDWRGSIALDPDALSGFDSDYNILVNSLSNNGDGTFMELDDWQALGYDQNSMLADDLPDIFEDPATGDYHLLENSQAIDAGQQALAQGIDDDLEGNPRPVGMEHDLGAYEFQEVLALEDESSTANSTSSRWIDVTQEGNSFLIQGLSADDYIVLSDMSARILFSVPAGTNGTLSIDLPGIPSGLYVLFVIDGRNVVGVRTIRL